jgi:very-short-patch-repair endonuclease
MIARKLRRDATNVEQRLWRALRTASPIWKFRRQHPIGRRIVDFACPAQKLAIELDGSQHADRQEEMPRVLLNLPRMAIVSFDSGTTRSSKTWTVLSRSSS